MVLWMENGCWWKAARTEEQGLEVKEFEVVATGLRFPEGPIAMADGSVILVEIAAKRLSRISADGKVETICELGGGPNGAAIGRDGYCYVCNNGGFTWTEQDGLLLPNATPDHYQGGRIERVDLATGAFKTIYDSCNGHRLNGPNDIVFDNQGGFWFTDAGKIWPRHIARGGIYYAAADGSRIEEVLYPLEFANGIALSPEQDRLYFVETLNGRLWSMPLAAPGMLASGAAAGNPDNFLYGASGTMGFDSMAIDSAGNICVATLFTGGISVISPQGQLLDFFNLPDPLVTNICFGGDDFRTAYITLSATGKLIKMPWPRPGLKLIY